jgi:ubiquinone/menaquinone biosynthesis C-methylase UbiE/DNA-binding transcriptional ArsR family regulator
MMDRLLSCLRATAEPTRLRLLSICADGDVTVTELTRILGQSQPRISRHLKLLCDAGLLDRVPEGSWVFYRLADQRTREGGVARDLAAMIPEGDPQHALDLAGLGEEKAARAAAANAYFRANAAQWDSLRSLYVDESEVEAALFALFPEYCGDLLDIGTGTGRMLRLLAGRIDNGVGIDASREMLSIARAELESPEFRHCHVRHGDMYHTELDAGSFDAVVVHMVLHYADRPSAIFAEAARVLRPDGQLIVVDFTPHTLESLRADHAHRRLGFDDREIAVWCRDSGLTAKRSVTLPGDPLTVRIWTATANPTKTETFHNRTMEEVS